LVVIIAAAGVALRGPIRRGLLRARRGPRRNVLLITADTTRADYLGFYGRAAARPGFEPARKALEIVEQAVHH
jgi:hypothetical protein